MPAGLVPGGSLGRLFEALRASVWNPHMAPVLFAKAFFKGSYPFLRPFLRVPIIFKACLKEHDSENCDHSSLVCFMFREILPEFLFSLFFEFLFGMPTSSLVFLFRFCCLSF